MIEILVPATSANIGPGYDCLGMALQYYGKFYFERIEEGFIIEGCDEQFRNQDNLVYQSFQRTFMEIGEDVPGVSIRIDCDIPLARGLGSSATCIVAGVFGANALAKGKLNTDTLFELCTKIEGHCDNIAPAIYGNLCASFIDSNIPYKIIYPVHESLSFLCMIPNYCVSTKEARSILPISMTYENCVYQIGHSIAMVDALKTGNLEMLKKACQDRMHEPYRKELIKHYDFIKNTCESNGISMVISGSGSTMMAISNDSEKLKKVVEIVNNSHENIDCKILKADNKGIQIKELTK